MTPYEAKVVKSALLRLIGSLPYAAWIEVSNGSIGQSIGDVLRIVERYSSTARRGGADE